MLNAIVQLIRNFLCCIKDLSYGSHPVDHPISWIYNYNITNSILNDYFNIQLLEPLQSTTPLEVFISIAQFYVVVTGVPESISNFIRSYYQMTRTFQLIEIRSKLTITNHAERLIHASLIQEGYKSIRSMFVSFNCFFICISFIWLSANSWHITKTTWIGGLPALINALTVMNICLTPLLYYMYIDAKEYFRNAIRIRSLYTQLLTGTVSDADLGLSSLMAISENEYVPFWSSNYTDDAGRVKNSTDTSVQHDIKLLQEEVIRVSKMIDLVTGKTAAKKKTDHGNDTTSSNDSIEKKEMTQIQNRVQNDLAIQIRPFIFKLQLYGIREILYFMINCIAWYGYGMCIVVYYFPIVLQQPDYVRILLLYYHNDDADWYGNFAGDVMWTIEPTIILFSPFIINLLTTPRRQRTTAAVAKPQLLPDDKSKKEL